MEKTEKMSVKTVRDRAAALGAANTYADVLLNAAGVLVASSRQDHLVKLKDGDNYVHIYLADTPCDYRGVMFVGSWRVETGVCKSMDDALSELRGNWGALYKEGLDSLRRAAVANALEEKREAVKAKAQEPKQPDVAMFDAMCKIHGIIRDMMRQPEAKDCERTIKCDLVEFSLKVYYRDGMWRSVFAYWDHESELSDKDYACLLTRVWWQICDVMGWMYE